MMYGRDAYSEALSLLSAPAMKVAYILVAWSFFFHLIAGIRHLAFDAGRGFDRRISKLTALSTFLLSALLAIGFGFSAIF
jgi:succinate dehydrogenase / fumarate reductase cytochrome b subunit